MTKAEFNLYHRAWRKRNPEKVKGYLRKRKLNRAVDRAYLQTWRRNNPERVKSYSRKQNRREIDELRPHYVRRQAKSRLQPTSEEQVRQRILLRRAQRLLKPMLALSALTSQQSARSSRS